MDIIKVTRGLNFPEADYIIIGGAAMAIRKIKETSDIDILVSQDLLKILRNSKEWSHHLRILANEEAGLVNKEKTVELYPEIANNSISFEELKLGQEVIEGIPVANLNHIIKIKQFYAREKDFKDIAIIRKYLEK